LIKRDLKKETNEIVTLTFEQDVLMQYLINWSFFCFYA